MNNIGRWWWSEFHLVRNLNVLSCLCNPLLIEHISRMFQKYLHLNYTCDEVCVRLCLIGDYFQIQWDPGIKYWSLYWHYISNHHVYVFNVPWSQKDLINVSIFGASHSHLPSGCVLLFNVVGGCKTFGIHNVSFHIYKWTAFFHNSFFFHDSRLFLFAF
jgi:hypothetical protein